MGIVEALQSKDALAAFAGAATAALYAFAFKYFLTRARQRRRLKEFKLHNAISTGLSNETLTTVEDFVNVYKGVHGLGADDISYRAGLAKALREYIVQVVSDDEINPQQANQLKSSASAILARIEAESPFADLPPAERNLLIDVSGFIQANDQQSALRKLEDLAGLIEVRQDSLERVQTSNKWSIPLAAVGLILTIIFGLISIFK